MSKIQRWSQDVAKLVRLHLSLSLNEKAGRRSADKDPDLHEIRAAIAKAKATMNP